MRRIGAIALFLVGLSISASASRADIVVLNNGGFIKITGYETGEDSVRIHLPMGGTMVLKLSIVERIVGDEIATGATTRPSFDLADVDLDFQEGESMPENSYTAMFVEVGRRYSLSSRFLASIARAESDFEPWARSNKGAIGLMQVMPATAERFGVDPGQLYDPLVCLDVGARYLAHLRERYEGDVALMLAAYNAGEATVERFGGVPPYLETQSYIRRVHRTYQGGG